MDNPIRSACYRCCPSINTWENDELGRWSVDGKTLLFTRSGPKSFGLFAAKFETKGKLISVEKFPFDSTYRGGGHTISSDGKKIIFATGTQGWIWKF
jgi:Tol biopolymer transport system component